jgi:hypothetical protein
MLWFGIVVATPENERRCDECGEPNPPGNLLCRGCGARLDAPRAGPPGGSAGRLVQIRRKGTPAPPATHAHVHDPGGDHAHDHGGEQAATGAVSASEPGLRPIAWGWLAAAVVAPFMMAMALMLLVGRTPLLANLGVATGVVLGAALVNLLRGPDAQLLEPILGAVTVYIVAAVITAPRAAAPVPLVVHVFTAMVVGALGGGGGWLGRWLRRRPG